MESFLNVLLFLVVVGVMLTGAYLLLNKFVPEMALKIKETIGGVLAKFQGK